MHERKSTRIPHNGQEKYEVRIFFFSVVVVVVAVVVVVVDVTGNFLY